MKVTLIALIDSGGMLHYASQLANSLCSHGEISIIIGKGSNTNLFNGQVRINLIDLPTYSFKQIFYIFNFFKIMKILARDKPDIIHISGNHFWIVFLYFYLKGKNTVLTLHDVEAHTGERNFKNNLNIQLHTKLAKHIFVHGENLKNALIKKGYPINDITVINHGDYSFFTKYKKNVKEDGSILFFGRIKEYKGLEYLLEAVPKIKKLFPNLNVIIAGRGDMDKYIKYIEKNIKNFEIINKFIPDESVAELFQRSSIVVLPYTEASQSGIIPIAYSFKKPVISTDVGSLSEVIENERTGLIVEPRNADALARAVIKLLLDDALRTEMGENAFNKMRKDLSWKTIAKRVVESYEMVIMNHKT